jgi:6-pyruvoyltetrahydropterin/6-carboxytetrahydropterin synthase
LTTQRKHASVGIGKLSCHFSASHLILTSDIVEGIHGHNYYVELEVFGKIGKDDLIYDFIYLEEILKKIASEWDHFLLLPKHNEGIIYEEKGDNLEIKYHDRFYSIPRTEVKLLECKNTSAEIFAKIIAEKYSSALSENKTKDVLSAITVILWETPQYYASYNLYL